MKKTYISPNTIVVAIQVRSHLMDLSAGGTASISRNAADGDAFVKEDNTSVNDVNVWDNEW